MLTGQSRYERDKITGSTDEPMVVCAVTHEQVSAAYFAEKQGIYRENLTSIVYLPKLGCRTA